MRRLVKEAKREKRTTAEEAYKADVKEWRAGKKEINNAFSKMNAELSLRLNPDSEAAGWIAEYAISEVSQQERYQKSWKRLEEKYAAKALADVDALRFKIASATDLKGWKALMGIYSSCRNQLKNIVKYSAEGLPCGDNSPTNTELRVWILKAMSNPNLNQIKVNAALDEHGTKYTFDDIVRDVSLVLKANPAWDIGSDTVLALSAKVSVIKRRSDFDVSTMECNRCHNIGHFANKCTASTCKRCGADLKVSKGRHYCSTNSPGEQPSSKKATPASRKTSLRAKGSSSVDDVGGASGGKQKTMKIKPSWGTMTSAEVGEEIKAFMAKAPHSN